ncbi:hypothetical protein ASE69_20230 [Sphingomonas sp. Leaf208]|uniref:hypothetical protein n=1 Tax=Sphingomonas sp. Leaf208 TaxID=1735679 RepID=UPI0006F3BF51|nr:hypothetical protein [Sphingomonas sp. Leaf208]KQM52144.1 hypothetical protein ASE69_20230 [Sphingomonas sp. Leaf208]
MEQRIIHACGHEQVHYLTGFDSQQERKVKWLKTTSCRDCFVAEKRAEEAAAAALSNAAISHLDLPPLTGTDRQVSWASTIRTKRLAVLINVSVAGRPQIMRLAPLALRFVQPSSRA